MISFSRVPATPLDPYSSQGALYLMVLNYSFCVKAWRPHNDGLAHSSSEISVVTWGQPSQSIIIWFEWLGKAREYRDLFRDVVFGDSFNGCHCPQWRSLWCRCLAHWSQGEDTSMLHFKDQSPSRWQGFLAVSARLDSQCNGEKKKKKEQRDQFRKYILLYSDNIHFTCFMRLMSPAPDYKNLIGILIRL